MRFDEAQPLSGSRLIESSSAELPKNSSGLESSHLRATMVQDLQKPHEAHLVGPRSASTSALDAYQDRAHDLEAIEMEESKTFIPSNSSSRLNNFGSSGSVDQDFLVQKIDSSLSAARLGRRRKSAREARKNASRCHCSIHSFRSDAVRTYRRLRTLVLFEVQQFGLVGWFFIFLLPCFVDLSWTILYFVERQQDVTFPDGPCTNSSFKPSPASETPRTVGVYTVQCLYAILTLFLWLPFRIFYAGSYKFRHILYLAVLADFVTALPIFVVLFIPHARDIYIPAFLRIWMFRFELGFLFTQSTLSGEIILFVWSSIAIGITMVACFEWTQNNFPVQAAIFASHEAPTYPCTSFLTSIYFIIVTLSTVGYGDVTPSNQYARAVAGISIAVFIVLLPYSVRRIGELLRKSSDRKHIRYSARMHNAHVVVHGHLDDAILGHVLYYFNPVRRARRLVRGQAILHNDEDDLSSTILAKHANTPGSANYVVVMSENEVSPEMISRVSLGYQRSYISLFEGSLLKAHDMQRCEIFQAQAVFVLPTLHVYADNVFMSSNSGAETTRSYLATMGFGSAALQAQSRGSYDLRRSSSVDNDGAHSEETLDFQERENLQNLHESMHRVHHASFARNRLYSRDYRTLLRAWSAHQNIHSDQLLVVILFHEFNKQFLFDHGASPADIAKMPSRSALVDRNLMTISLDAFQQEVLAASCLVPGFSTVITNFFVGEDRGVSVVNESGNKTIHMHPGPEVTYDLELGEQLVEESGGNDHGRHRGLDHEADESAPRRSVQNVFERPILGSLNAGFTFHQSSRPPSSTPQERARMLRHEENQSSRHIFCPCHRQKEKPLNVLRSYGYGLQNELEVMIVKESNPFVGWTRLELAITVHRDFGVIALAIIREEDANYTKGNQREVEFFRNGHQEIKVGDHVVFLGRGNHMDALFHTRKEDYELHSNFSIGKPRRRRNSKSFLHSSLVRTRSSPGFHASGQRQHVRGKERSSSTQKERALGRLDSSLTRQESQESAPDFFEEENILDPHSTVPLDIDEASECTETSETPRQTLVEAFITSWDDFVHSGDAGVSEDHGHIILCSPHHSPIDMFIQSLASKQDNTNNPPIWIVWMVSSTPSDMIWERLSRIPNVVWMLGESCVANDLLRAGIRKASDVVIFSDIFENYVPNLFAPSEAVEPADVDRYTISSHRVVTSLIEAYHLIRLRVHTHINNASNGQYLHESMWRRLILERAYLEESAPEKLPSNDSETKSDNSFWSRLFRSSEDSSDTLQLLNQLTASVWPILLNETYAAGESWSASCVYFILFSSYMGGGCGIIFLLVQKLINLAGRKTLEPGEHHGFRLVRVPRNFHGKTFAQLYSASLFRNGALCLGLFRGYGHGMNHPRYGKPTVLINPVDTEIVPCDYVYVIGGVRHGAASPGRSARSPFTS